MEISRIDFILSKWYFWLKKEIGNPFPYNWLYEIYTHIVSLKTEFSLILIAQLVN